MKIRGIFTAPPLLAIFLSVTGCGELLGPSSYNDCVLKNIGKVSTDKAVNLLSKTCRAKFSSLGSHESASLNSSQIRNIQGKAGFDEVAGSYYYMGFIYNANTDVTVTEITIRITATTKSGDIVRDYNDTVTVKPLSMADFMVEIPSEGDDASYSWRLLSAQGYSI